MTQLRALYTMDELRPAVDLFTRVWGRNEDGVPVSGEMLRSLVHAGGLVSGAFDGRELVGAAAAGRARPGHCYSYLAAARPGRADRGIGFALKLHQREWAQAEGLHTMEWTFDPLVRRNARFNLVKLGAVAEVYEPAFYGEMHDEQNVGEVGDRLVARWRLDSARVVRAVRGQPPEVPSPPPQAQRVSDGPDEQPCLVAAGDDRWVRVPADIVALRHEDRTAAARWRISARRAFQSCFAAGFRAVGLTGDWYHLRSESA